VEQAHSAGVFGNSITQPRKGRKPIAHGVSHGSAEAEQRGKPRKGRKNHHTRFLSPLLGLTGHDATPSPGLAPWAIRFRRYAADQRRHNPRFSASIPGHPRIHP